MRGWLGVVEVLVLVLALFVLTLLLLALRRRWLARQGATFECSVRLSQTTPGSGWALGLARYNAENLQWFRFFSFSLRPRKSFLRNDVRVIETREPNQIEAVSLYAGQRVVSFEIVDDSITQTWELAMSPDSMTGLLSWLESAPPGVGGY